MRKQSMLIHYILSLVLEIGTTAAFSLGAWRMFQKTDGLRIPAVILVFVVVVICWSTFLMRQAPKKLSMPLLAVAIVALAVGSVLILAFSQFRMLASVLGIVTIIDVLLLVFLWKRYPEAVSDFSLREAYYRPETKRLTKRNFGSREAVRPARSQARSSAGIKRPSRRR